MSKTSQRKRTYFQQGYNDFKNGYGNRAEFGSGLSFDPYYNDGYRAAKAEYVRDISTPSVIAIRLFRAVGIGDVQVIDWKAAPVWARYNAKDRDGRVFWHENKPSAGATSWLNKGGMSLAWNTEQVDEEWRNTLEERK